MLVVLQIIQFTHMNTWHIDTAHSNISFKIKHLTVSTVKGSFKTFTGTATTLDDSFVDATLDTEIQVASITTNNDQRDGHLLSPDFFDVEKFPTAHFVSTSFKNVESNTFAIAGNLTIKGITKEYTLTAEFNGLTNSMDGKKIASFSAETILNRADFGLSWNAPLEAGGLILGETVTLELDIEFILAA